MIITWYGQFCFRIQSGEVNILIDPPPKGWGIKAPKDGANILILTGSHKYEEMERFKNAFVIDGPGEYELKKSFIQGIENPNYEKSKTPITLYKIEMESIAVCHMGAITEGDFQEKGLEKLGDVDILMIPVGGPPSIIADTASKIINQIEPCIAIPMQFKIQGLKLDVDKVDKLLRIMGQKGEEALPKLVIKKKDLPQEETKVVVLQAS